MVEIRYIVHNVDEAITFYTDLLQFKLKQQFGSAMAILVKDTLELWVAGPKASASRPMPDGRQPAPGGWNRIVVIVDDIEAKTAQLKKAGVTFRNEIISGPGGRQVICEDPSQNPIELFEPAQ